MGKDKSLPCKVTSIMEIPGTIEILLYRDSKSFQVVVEDPRNEFLYVFKCYCELGKANQWKRVPGM